MKIALLLRFYHFLDNVFVTFLGFTRLNSKFRYFSAFPYKTNDPDKLNNNNLGIDYQFQVFNCNLVRNAPKHILNLFVFAPFSANQSIILLIGKLASLCIYCKTILFKRLFFIVLRNQV